MAGTHRRSDPENLDTPSLFSSVFTLTRESPLGIARISQAEVIGSHQRQMVMT